MDQLYCTVRDLEDELGDLQKSDEYLVGKIEEASQQILMRRGPFLPVTEVRKFAHPGTGSCGELLVPALLEVTTLTNDGTALVEGTDFVLWPNGRHWEDGPFSAIVLINGGAWSTLTEGVIVTGKWGLYDGSVALGVSVTTADAVSTGLAVGDGSKCAPGMVLRIGSEQLVVTALSSTGTDTTADLSEDVDDTETEWTISDGTKVFVGETLKVGFEQVLVLDISGNDMLVARGWNHTARAAHLTGVNVYALRTFAVRRGCNGTTAAAHSAEAAYRVFPPANVGYLCKQITSLMIKKAQTGFVGRSGNDDLGTGFWVNEFPRTQMDAVLDGYFWGG